MHQECRDLRPILQDMEQALLDLQGPLDTLGLLADTLPAPQAASMTWLVDTATSSTVRLREEWEKLHAITQSAEEAAPEDGAHDSSSSPL
jgi:hypothetical protein